MQTSACEKATVPETTDEPQPQQDMAAPATSPEPAAGELEVIEGEVVELEPQMGPEASPLPQQKPYWLLIPFAILLCLLFFAGSYVLPLLTPTATVTIVPVERSITITTTAIRVHGRLLPTFTLSQSQTVPATGKRHQDATQAQGEITFYNGLLTWQTIPAGTTLTGQDGVAISTDQAARIPPASNTTPPTFGQVTIAAHAVQPGAQGNIPPYDINSSCCTASILVKNTTAFTGGQNERDATVVTRQDINTAVTSLLTTLSQVGNAARQAQLHSGEALLPASGTPHVSTDHKAGDEAKHVSVSVSVTCGGIAYAAHEVDQEATQMATVTSTNRFGTGYIPLGDTHVTITHAIIANLAQGMVTVAVKIEATVVYHITSGEKEQMRRFIAGKTPKLAQAILLHLPGVAGAAITIKGNTVFPPSDAATLPDNPKAITIVIAERL